MVSEPRISKMDCDEVTSLLNSAAFVEDDYRPRVKYVVQRPEPRSRAFDLTRQMRKGVEVEPHYRSQPAFNEAGPAATMHAFYGDAFGCLTTKNKRHVVKGLEIDACPTPSLSPEEQLDRMTKTKRETWLGFVDRYCATCVTTTASRKTQVKTLYRKLPINLRKLMLPLPSTATLADMSSVLRNASFWESSTQSRTETDEDATDPDMATTQVNVGIDGRVIGSDGSINFSAITNAGRVMIGAREICKTSKREALKMLRFLERICNGNDGPTGSRRPRGQPRRRTLKYPRRSKFPCLRLPRTSTLG